MMDLFYFIVTLAILVTVHEFGHFWVARKCGVKVLTFSVGFGHPLWQRTDASGTRYVLAAIPLGGYVKMLDEREAPVPDEQQGEAFNRQSLWARTAIVSAGPLANFLLAIAVYWVVFVIGVPGHKPVIGHVTDYSPAAEAGLASEQTIVSIDGTAIESRAQARMALLKRIGDSGEIQLQTMTPGNSYAVQHEVAIEQWLTDQETPDFHEALGFDFWQPAWPPVIDAVVPDQPAGLSGIKAGDRMIAINNEPVELWDDAARIIRANPGRTISIDVERQGAIHTLPVTVEAHSLTSGEQIGRIGVMVQLPEMPEDMLVTVQSGVIKSLFYAASETWDMVVFTLDSIKKMLAGLISPANLSGPVTIAKIAAASAQSGITPYLQFLALISISLGVLNLLPIPVLDGGHLLMLGAEAVLGKPLPERILILAQQSGLLLILSIMALALYNDFTRL